MAEFPDALIEQAAQAMEAHRRYDGGQIGVDCECGETFREFPAYDAHDRHAARAVLQAVTDELRADAWDKGYSHGIDQHRPGQIITGRRANPYRRGDQ